MKRNLIDVYTHERGISDAMEWDKWGKEIPFIQLKPDWQFAPIPPFHGAVVRFRVKLPTGTTKSIYLDCYDILGCYGEPYWEVYPYNGDVGRCAINDVDELVRMIGDEQ